MLSLRGLIECFNWSPAGETLAGRAVAFAEGNALGKGPQILRLGPDDVAWIRRRAAAGDPIFMQLEVRA